MPNIAAFRALRYNLGHVGSLSDVIAPPYDVIGPELQDRLLGETQRGSLQGEQFLRILISITLEGFLGDPMYGGNLNGVGWKLTQAAPTSERPRYAGMKP